MCLPIFAYKSIYFVILPPFYPLFSIFHNFAHRAVPVDKHPLHVLFPTSRIPHTRARQSSRLRVDPLWGRKLTSHLSATSSARINHPVPPLVRLSESTR